MIFDRPLPEPTPLIAKLQAAYRMDEAACVEQRLHEAAMPPGMLEKVGARARELVEAVRAGSGPGGGIDAFMHEYQLSSSEGIVLMCLAEALLRVPDAETADRLIMDKIGGADWEGHLGRSDSVFVNASTWALMLTGRVIAMDEAAGGDWRAVVRRLVARSGEPFIRQAVTRAMRVLGRQFVMGRSIDEALSRAREAERKGYRFSFDMLGEAACTMVDADRYLRAYVDAIDRLGRASRQSDPIRGPEVSVKLSALHPRYEHAQRARIMDELAPRVTQLALSAARAGVGLTIDAEEADRLELSLEVLERVSMCADLHSWPGLGFAVQAYLKRAMPLLDCLADVAQRGGRRLKVRLVKGAYWDTEIKRSQVGGYDGYPVFTRKPSSDVSYLACVKRLFASPDTFYGAFATHNAHTVAAVIELAGDSIDYEFQRLHGMGEALYERLVGPEASGLPCRIYAPVGSHEDLLAYLVRRLLENGSNTSFVNRIVERDLPVESIAADPIARVARLEHKPHPRIALPRGLYGEERVNARGIDLTDYPTLRRLQRALDAAAERLWQAVPLVGDESVDGQRREVRDPADLRRTVGTVVAADARHAARAVALAKAAQPSWDAAGADRRAACLADAADLYEEHSAELMALAVREAGKTLPDAVAEVREAVDFLRYYADRARRDFGAPLSMPGPTGEDNWLALHGRGAFVCISPWNFPLAIFTGQISAALAAGNAVLAKPAEQTPLIAARAIALLHEAGVPRGVLSLLPGEGPEVGAALVADPRIDGVAFTGSTETARGINRALAARNGSIVPLIAETGGQNAMIVDSTALLEQVTHDVVTSAFQSAGQRCSALRVLFAQEEIAERLLTMIAGAMDELRVGDPAMLATDVGPVIDADALEMLRRHEARMTKEAKLIHRAPLAEGAQHGHFFAPCAFEIDAISRLEREVFGPVLHVVRYRANRLDNVIDAINDTGYGLTLGIHSRIDKTVRHIASRVRVGNAYVNRNQIGAVVGVQPFGGEGLSGTGPKAGGPHYLQRFACERTLTVDTTAAGGNAALMGLVDD